MRGMLTGLVAVSFVVPPAPSLSRSALHGAAGVQELSGWNIQYAVPSGWQPGQDFGRVKMLGSNSEAGGIFVGPGLYSSFEEMAADVIRFYQAMGLAAQQADQGTYTVIGTTLVTKGSQGQQAFQLQILADRIVSDGRVYLRAN